jgi:protein-tyrosine phosphatase
MGYQYVLPRLAQGSAPAPYTPLPFDVLVLCAKEYQPDRSWFPGVELIYAPFDDSGPPPTREELGVATMASRAVVRAYRHGKRVLVTCHMGRNRSGLVMGLALMQLGFTSRQSIALIRYARDGALSNTFFRDVLKKCDASQAQRAQAI